MHNDLQSVSLDKNILEQIQSDTQSLQQLEQEIINLDKAVEEALEKLGNYKGITSNPPDIAAIPLYLINEEILKNFQSIILENIASKKDTLIVNLKNNSQLLGIK